MTELTRDSFHEPLRTPSGEPNLCRKCRVIIKQFHGDDVWRDGQGWHICPEGDVE